MWLTVTKITSSYQLNKPLIAEARRFHQEPFRGCLVKVLREFFFLGNVVSGKRLREIRVISEEKIYWKPCLGRGLGFWEPKLVSDMFVSNIGE